MSQIEHKDCFGKMYPDDLHLRNNRPNKGKVFTVHLSSSYGVITTRKDRQIEVDIDEWDDCQKCPEFESCYKLSLARVALESAIVTQ